MTNYDWFAVLDRISVIQSSIHDNVYSGSNDEHLKKLLDEAQEKLSQAYQYAGVKLDESES